MPRRNRRVEPEPLPSPSPRSAAPAWAVLAGFEIRTVRGEREYRCPGCDHVVRAGSQHLVVVPVDDVDARRHWHTECWRRELRM